MTRACALLDHNVVELLACTVEEEQKQARENWYHLPSLQQGTEVLYNLPLMNISTRHE